MLSPPLQDVLPASSSVSNFLQDFGPNTFILWKLALLQKRILFCSPPPVGRTCLQGEAWASAWIHITGCSCLLLAFLSLSLSLCMPCSAVHLPDD